MARKSQKRASNSLHRTAFISLLLFACVILGLITSLIVFRYMGVTDDKTFMSIRHVKPDVSAQEEDYKRTLRGIDVLVFETWKNKLDRAKPDQVYSEFKKAYHNINTNDAHTYSHIFGALLYINLGVKGIDICDSDFAYGCYHSFMAKAIEEQGTSVIYTLSRHCEDNLLDLQSVTTGCQHGVGHGILSYYGYTLHSLSHAVSVCQGFETPDERKACEAGVYMEYDFRTMLLDEGVRREFVQSDPYDPCDKLEKKLQYSCYYWHMQWVIDTFYTRMSIDDEFKEIGKMCSEIKETDNKQQCFSGAGHFVGQYVYWDIPIAAKVCKEFSDYGNAAVTGCLAAAKQAYIFYGSTNADKLYGGPASTY
jgi:hypothetical protein